MANRYAVATGNWSSLATWDGGASLPGAGDVVRPNGYTVTIDQDVTVGTLTNNASSPAAAGGNFVCSTSRTIVANITAGTVPCLVCSGVTGTTVAIVGNVSNSTSSGSTAVRSTSSGTVNITGNVIVVDGSPIYVNTVTVEGGGTVNLTGNVNCLGGGTYGAGVNVSNGSLNVTGNVTGVSVQNSNLSYGINLSSGAVVITGNVSGGSAGTNTLGVNVAGGSLTVNGNVYGGTTYAGNNGIKIDPTAASTVVVNGSIRPNGTCNAIVHVLGVPLCKLIHNGDITSDASGKMAVGSGVYLIDATTEMQYAFRHSDGGTPGAERKLYTGGVNIGQPGEADVRYATTFGAMDEYTGSLRVPDPSYVSLGVMTDNTTGTLTASLDAAAIRAALGMASADLDTQLDAINAKTINLPSDPASESNVDDAKSYAATAVSNTVAILSKLLKYFQLTLRKDAAIATDNATELAEINADGGSGAGSVDNTADSTQAIASDKDGYKLASDGLDAIDTTAPAGVASNFREMVVQLWRRFHKLVRRNKTTKQIVQYADDNTTPLVTQSYDDTADEEIVGDAS